MNDPRLIELRELLLEAPEPAATRILAITGSLALVAVVLWLVRGRRLREEFTPVWLLLAAGVAIGGLFPGLLRELTRLIGAWTPSSTLFFFGEAALFAICLGYAVRLSQLTLQLKNLSQELTLLRARLDRGDGAAG